jgi:hypothetical protein
MSEGKSKSEIIAQLKEDGFSFVDSIKIIMELYEVTLRSAKRTMSDHFSWEQVVDNNKKLHDEFLEVFGKKFKGKKNNNNGKSIIMEDNLAQVLNYSELEDLSSEIKSAIVGLAQSPDDTLYNLSEKFPVSCLGVRKSRALMHEYKLTTFFTPQVYMKIRNRVKDNFEKGLLEFNESDFEFLIENKRKGSEFIAKSFYITKDEAKDLIKDIV